MTMTYFLLRGLVWFCLSLMAITSQAEDAKRVMDIHDQASLQRGLATYSNYCSGCHSLKYIRYKRVAEDLGIPKALFEKNLLPRYAKFDDAMTSALAPSDAKKWFGIVPPDLTLEARRRSPDWIYRYLQGFYRDHSRPFGVNNLVLPNTMMPNVLASLQGSRSLTCQQDGNAKDQAEMSKKLASITSVSTKCAIVAGNQKAQMTEQEFNRLTYDVANFLNYTADPSRIKRESLGLKVLIFLVLFAVIAYLLKREFWRDIK